MTSDGEGAGVIVPDGEDHQLRVRPVGRERVAGVGAVDDVLTGSGVIIVGGKNRRQIRYVVGRLSLGNAVVAVAAEEAGQIRTGDAGSVRVDVHADARRVIVEGHGDHIALAVGHGAVCAALVGFDSLAVLGDDDRAELIAAVCVRGRDNRKSLALGNAIGNRIAVREDFHRTADGLFDRDNRVGFLHVFYVNRHVSRGRERRAVLSAGHRIEIIRNALGGDGILRIGVESDAALDRCAVEIDLAFLMAGHGKGSGVIGSHGEHHQLRVRPDRRSEKTSGIIVGRIDDVIARRHVVVRAEQRHELRDVIGSFGRCNAVVAVAAEIVAQVGAGHLRVVGVDLLAHTGRIIFEGYGNRIALAVGDGAVCAALVGLNIRAVHGNSDAIERIAAVRVRSRGDSESLAGRDNARGRLAVDQNLSRAAIADGQRKIGAGVSRVLRGDRQIGLRRERLALSNADNRAGIAVNRLSRHGVFLVGEQSDFSADGFTVHIDGAVRRTDNRAGGRVIQLDQHLQARCRFRIPDRVFNQRTGCLIGSENRVLACAQ